MHADQQRFPIASLSDVGHVRRHVVHLFSMFQHDEVLRGRAALVATELANNLVRHAGQGELLVQILSKPVPTLEVISIDRGRGMRDVNECLRDGFSSGGTPGTGLGAVRRFSTEFDIYSQPERGTVVLSRLPMTTESATRSSWLLGTVTVAAPGERVIGDSWRVIMHERGVRVLVADGLGHGPLASKAAETACTVFEADAFQSIGAFFAQAHQALRPTRGAAAAVATINVESNSLNFAGVGNIAALINALDGTNRSLMSQNGTLGAEMRTISELRFDFREGDRLILHSDGLTSRWSLSAYPGLMRAHPAIIAAILYRDNLRGRDDATVVVLERRV